MASPHSPAALTLGAAIVLACSGAFAGPPSLDAEKVRQNAELSFGEVSPATRPWMRIWDRDGDGGRDAPAPRFRTGRSVTLLGIVLLSTGAGETPPEPARPKAAAQAIAGLRTELGGALKKALEEGATHAVDFCHLEAPGITARQQQGLLRVGRTSDRLRNPANAPEDWMIPFLEEFRARPPEPGSSRTVDLGARGTGYVEPIYLKPLCATCHGEGIAPSLLAEIQTRYPEDRATGYRVGELRGLFWAVVADETESAPTPSAPGTGQSGP